MFGHSPLWSPGGCGPPGRPGAVRSRRTVGCDSSTLRGRVTRKSAKSARPAAGQRAWAPPTALWPVHGRPALQPPLRRRGQLKAQHLWHRPLHRPGTVPVFLTAPSGTARHIVPTSTPWHRPLHRPGTVPGFLTAPSGTARHTCPAPPGTARHIVPTQHLRYWAGVSSPHLRCGAGVGRAGVWCGAGVGRQTWKKVSRCSPRAAERCPGTLPGPLRRPGVRPGLPYGPLVIR